MELSNEEFCKIYTATCGEEITTIKQLVKIVHTGEELMEFFNTALKIYLSSNDTYNTGFSEGYAEAVRDKNEEIENHLNYIGQLQEQLKEAENEIRDLNRRD